jgi:L-alanine-DL-glutamate epimerase-like enolase superfamily enzyme
MEFAQNILIKIHTDEGIIGWGECSAFPMIVGETQQSCYLLAKDFAAFWKGKDPLAMEERLKELDQIDLFDGLILDVNCLEFCTVL